jgi:hypothetical protein
MEAYRNEDIVSTLLRHGFIELFLRMDETLLNEYGVIQEIVISFMK